MHKRSHYASQSSQKLLFPFTHTDRMKLAVKKAMDKQHVQQLLVLFPNGDPEYFESCLGHYLEDPVERITEKIVTQFGGHYPQLSTPQQPHDNRLNACLRILALDLFPDCDIGYLRDLIYTFQYAHVEQVVETLISRGGLWPERLEYGKMNPSESIKSERYKRQAQMQLIQDYPQIWKSSIKAVLAENNWDYSKCFHQLKEMGSGGFWNTLRNFFIHWSIPSSMDTQQVVTDHHLQKQLRQLQQLSIDQQVKQDHHYAHKVNLLEYSNQYMTCDCCYGDVTFEQVLFCSEATHSFCHTCLTRYMTEGLFGQGALRGQSRIACISSTDECPGCFQFTMLKKVLSVDIWLAYENSLLDGGTQQQQRIQCCACPYFELDEFTRPLASTLVYASQAFQWMTKWIMVVVELFLLLFFCHDVFMLPLLMFIFSLQWISFFQWDMKSDLETAYLRVSKSRRGTMFSCRNQSCKTLTCLQCQRPVRGMHTCWEKETDGLRLYIEKAMADAVKRTCPNCSLSFQKSDGCNKIVCRCGYTMCYVCRKDIGKESYAHFCAHFRERPGTKCTQCKKCDLYKTAPEDEAVQLAASKAKNQYLKAHPEVAAHHTNKVIGPKNTLDKLDEMRQELVIWCLARGLEFIV